MISTAKSSPQTSYRHTYRQTFRWATYTFIKTGQYTKTTNASLIPHLQSQGENAVQIQSQGEKETLQVSKKAQYHVDLSVLFQSAKHIENFFLFKDRVLSQIFSSVVYKFTRNSCQATYNGKTSCHFIVQCKIHLGTRRKYVRIRCFFVS